MKITPKDALAMLQAEGTHVTLIDVRHRHEFDAGHIPGAIWIDNDDIDLIKGNAALPVDLDAPIILYCRTGARVQQAKAKLEALGYDQVYDLGGIVSWPFEIVS